jgi:hypothetical protein
VDRTYLAQYLIAGTRFLRYPCFARGPTRLHLLCRAKREARNLSRGEKCELGRGWSFPDRLQPSARRAAAAGADRLESPPGIRFSVCCQFRKHPVSRFIPPNVTVKMSHAATASTFDSRLSTGAAEAAESFLTNKMASSCHAVKYKMQLPRQSVNDLARSKRPHHGSGRLAVRAQNRTYLAKEPWDLQGTSSASRRCPSAPILAASLAAAQPPGRSCQEYLTQDTVQRSRGGGGGVATRRRVRPSTTSTDLDTDKTFNATSASHRPAYCVAATILCKGSKRQVGQLRWEVRT